MGQKTSKLHNQYLQLAIQDDDAETFTSLLHAHPSLLRHPHTLALSLFHASALRCVTSLLSDHPTARMRLQACDVRGYLLLDHVLPRAVYAPDFRFLRTLLAHRVSNVTEWLLAETLDMGENGWEAVLATLAEISRSPPHCEPLKQRALATVARGEPALLLDCLRQNIDLLGGGGGECTQCNTKCNTQCKQCTLHLHARLHCIPHESFVKYLSYFIIACNSPVLLRLLWARYSVCLQEKARDREVSDREPEIRLLFSRAGLDDSVTVTTGPGSQRAELAGSNSFCRAVSGSQHEEVLGSNYFCYPVTGSQNTEASGSNCRSGPNIIARDQGCCCDYSEPSSQQANVLGSSHSCVGSLQHLARVRVRHSFHGNALYAAAHCGLPPALEGYVLLKS